MSRRVERAKTLLEVPARSVTEVGMMLGFAETNSFTTSFRRSVGLTPSRLSPQRLVSIGRRPGGSAQ
jgi:AraC family transcriptional regulator